MQTIADLIDAAKARTGANYTELGTRLDRSKQLITNWRSGAKVPTDGDVMALARMAGQDVDKWLAIAQAARTEGEARTRWEQIARKLGAAAAMALCAIGFSLPMAGNAHATRNAGLMASEDVQGNAYYVKGDWAWWARLVRWWLAWKLRGSRYTPWRPMACNAA